MPLPRRAPQTPGPFLAELGSAAGPSVRDFYVLAHSSEYDEVFEHTNPPTFQSPTSRFTHVFHYRDGVRDQVHRVNDRLLTLWQSPTGETLAAGFPRGIFVISSSGVSEIVFKGHAGVFTGIWGPSSDHVFACGMVPPFVLHRLHGQWQPLPLPASSATVLRGVSGVGAADVYVVGNAGTILHYDGRDLAVLEVPTTRELARIAPLGKNVCVAGDEGVLLFGSVNGWRQIPSGTDETLDGLAAWQGHVFFGTSDGVWRFDGASKPTIELKKSAARVQGFADGLLVVNGADAWLWDGTTLTPLDTTI